MGDILQEAELVTILNGDLKHEWQHLKFYLHHASMLIGLHAEEYSEVFMKQAAGEMNHVRQFSDMIIGLGGVPTHENLPFNSFRHVEEALKYAPRAASRSKLLNPYWPSRSSRWCKRKMA